MHFCATCDGPFYKGKHVAVIGGGNSAAEESLLLTKFADSHTGSEETLAVDGAFVFIGLGPNTAFLSKSDVRLNEWGFVVTGHDLVHDGDRPPGYERREPAALETSAPGLFAAGDVRQGSTKQVASAAGEGAAAALLLREYLKTV